MKIDTIVNTAKGFGRSPYDVYTVLDVKQNAYNKWLRRFMISIIMIKSFGEVQWESLLSLIIHNLWLYWQTMFHIDLLLIIYNL